MPAPEQDSVRSDQRRRRPAGLLRLALRRFQHLAVAALLVSGLAAAAAADPMAAPLGPGLVRCYDPALQTITITANCHDQIVTAAQAQAIEQRREERVKQAVEAKPVSIPGRHLTRLGSGFMVTANGMALTNNHVIAGCAGLTTEGASGATAAMLVAADPADDLALLATRLAPEAVVAFRPPGLLATGSFAGIVGYPDLGLPRITPLLTPGRVMGMAAHAGQKTHLVLKADVRHGDSGGPVVDDEGAVIGIIQAEINTPVVYEKLHEVIEDVGLAVPEATVLRFLERHHIGYRLAVRSPALDQPALLRRAQAFVLRIGCWT